jgi:putative PEP-CTERM system TPR-repeat lipoprotein
MGPERVDAERSLKKDYNPADPLVVMAVAPVKGKHMKRFRSSCGFALYTAFTVTVLLVASCGRGGTSVEESIEAASRFAAENNHEAAIIELKNALQLDPDSARARWVLGTIYIDVGYGEAAEKELTRAQELGYEDPGLDKAIVKSLIMQRKSQEALEHLENLLGVDRDAELLSFRAAAYAIEGDFEAADDDYQRALDIDQQSIDATLGLAEMSRWHGDIDTAYSLALEAHADHPDNEHAALFLAGLEILRQDYPAAQKLYVEAERIAPNSLAAKLGRVRAYLLTDDIANAKPLLLALSKDYPKSADLKYLRGVVATLDGDADGAIGIFREILSVVPTHTPSQLRLGKLLYDQNNLAQAEEYISGLLQTVPGFAPARKLLAAIQLQRGNATEALETLAPLAHEETIDSEAASLLSKAYLVTRDYDRAVFYMNKVASDDPEGRFRDDLATGYMQAGKSEKAIEILEETVSQQPKALRPKVLLLYSHIQLRRWDAALALAKDMLAEDPDNPVLHNAIGAVYLWKQDYAAVRRHIDTALELAPDFEAARINLAALESAEGNKESARRLYEQTLANEPENVDAIMALAKILLEADEVEQATHYLMRARELDTVDIRPRILLGQLAMNRGDAGSAVDYLEEARALSPQNATTLRLLSEAQVRAGNVAGAIQTSRTLAEIYPETAIAQYHLGIAERLAGRETASRIALTKALRLQPKFKPALVALGRLEIKAGDLDAASEVIDELNQDHPGDAQTLELMGDVAAVRGDLAVAADRYEQALQSQPSSGVAVKRFNMLRRSNNDDGAAAFARAWMIKHPGDLAVPLARAQALEHDDDEAAAIAAYRKILDAHPDNPAALNNLASLLHETDDEESLSMAERAYAQAPNNPMVLDTYGWILITRGNLGEGLSLLEQAIAKLPGSADIRYHLAVALAKKGERVLALKEIDTALETEAFAERERAERLREALAPTR